MFLYMQTENSRLVGGQIRAPLGILKFARAHQLVYLLPDMLKSAPRGSMPTVMSRKPTVVHSLNMRR